MSSRVDVSLKERSRETKTSIKNIPPSIFSTTVTFKLSTFLFQLDNVEAEKKEGWKLTRWFEKFQVLNWVIFNLVFIFSSFPAILFRRPWHKSCVIPLSFLFTVFQFFFSLQLNVPMQLSSRSHRKTKTSSYISNKIALSTSWRILLFFVIIKPEPISHLFRFPTNDFILKFLRVVSSLFP